MLRECARYEALAKIMLYSDDFFNFFRYVEVSTFDIASDAFSTFKVSCKQTFSYYFHYRTSYYCSEIHALSFLFIIFYYLKYVEVLK